MHERLNLPRHETIVDEKIFVDAKLRVTPFQIPGTIPLHAVPQDQILRARRRADWIGLHESKVVQRAF